MTPKDFNWTEQEIADFKERIVAFKSYRFLEKDLKPQPPLLHLNIVQMKQW